MKQILSVMALVVVATVFAEPYVTNVVVKQRYPWNGLVDIDYEIVGSTNGLDDVYGQVTAEDRQNGKTYVATTFVEPLNLSEGKHRAVWDLSADAQFKSSNVVFRMSMRLPALYMVIDLQSGPSSECYPISELDEVPAGGWSSEYKTTKLVLRRIEPGSWKVKNEYSGIEYVFAVDKPFYVGVFEVTQKQYELIMGENPSEYKGNARPVESVSYNMIRGPQEPWNGNTKDMVKDESFLGKLRLRTEQNFDLPTSVQWDLAYREGSTTEDDLKRFGRCQDNCDDGKGGYVGAHTQVGSYMVNACGLYDMYGNVAEWCRDGSGSIATGEYVWYLRGNCWSGRDPLEDRSSRTRNDYGFRIVLELP